MNNQRSNGAMITLIAVVAFGLGFVLGQVLDFTGDASPDVTNLRIDRENDRGDTVTGQSETGTEGEIDISADDLSNGQAQMLRTMGIDPNNVTITDAMVACAEAKLGTARLEEIKGGATPSITEGAQLMACYSAS